MPFDYRNTSDINGNKHLVILEEQNHTLDLELENSFSVNLKDRDEHFVVFESPVGSYLPLIDKPQINNVELIGNLSLETLGIQPIGDYPYEPISSEDIDVITGFVTTKEAFARVLENSNEVYIESDIEFTEQININKTFTIILDNHSVSSEIIQPLFYVDGAVLTIKGTGTINVPGEICTTVNDGEIILEITQ